MEPERRTDIALLGILEELQRREPIFHRPEYGTTRADFETMMAEEFWETGASGSRYSREHVLDVLEQRHLQPQEDLWRTSDFQCLKIASDNFLLTYTLAQGERVTRRATIWRSTAEGWKIVYHQGTIVSNDASPVAAPEDRTAGPRQQEPT